VKRRKSRSEFLYALAEAGEAVVICLDISLLLHEEQQDDSV
jgi:hypothetical protein